MEIAGVAAILRTESTQTGDSIDANKLTSLPQLHLADAAHPGRHQSEPERHVGPPRRRPYVNGNRE
ncbi:MAG: hypothetical protein ACREUF_09045 [Solimonas sp.]